MDLPIDGNTVKWSPTTGDLSCVGDVFFICRVLMFAMFCAHSGLCPYSLMGGELDFVLPAPVAAPLAVAAVGAGVQLVFKFDAGSQQQLQSAAVRY